jgi:hypothetical protein
LKAKVVEHVEEEAKRRKMLSGVLRRQKYDCHGHMALTAKAFWGMFNKSRDY